MGITVRALQAAASAIAKPLAWLLTLVIRTGKVPSAWRVSDWRAMPKPGKRVCLQNMRPLSITSLFSRLAESVLLRRIPTDVLRSVMGESQFGFARGCTTTDAIEAVLRKIEYALTQPTGPKGRNGVGLAMLVDFSSAFTTVDPAAAIKRLREKRVPPYIITFVEGWLHDRHATMTMDDGAHRRARLDRGVPQGSVLGPLLWAAAMAGLLDNLDKSLERARRVEECDESGRRSTRLGAVAAAEQASFADDLTVTVCASDLSLAARAMQGPADVITKWADDNGVGISTKTELVALRGTETLTPQTDHCYIGTPAAPVATVTIGGVMLAPRVGPFRLLGVHLKASNLLRPPCVPGAPDAGVTPSPMDPALAELKAARNAIGVLRRSLAASAKKAAGARTELREKRALLHERTERLKSCAKGTSYRDTAKLVTTATKGVAQKRAAVSKERAHYEMLRKQIREREGQMEDLYRKAATPRLSAAPHVERLVESTRTSNRVIQRLQNILPPTDLGVIAESFVYSRVMYGAASWAPRVTRAADWQDLDGAVAGTARAVLGLHRSTANERAVRLMGHRSASFEALAMARRAEAKSRAGDADDPSILAGVDLSHVRYLVPPDELKKSRFDLAALLAGPDGRPVTDSREIASRLGDHPLVRYNKSIADKLGSTTRLWSTDGSRQGQTSGYSVVCWASAPRDDKAVPLDARLARCTKPTAPFRTEHRAINNALAEALRIAMLEAVDVSDDARHFAIITDSRSTMERIRSSNTREADTRQALTLLRDLGRLGYRVTLAFAFSHIGLHANEQADIYATIATSEYIAPKRLRKMLLQLHGIERVSGVPDMMLLDMTPAPVDDDESHWYDEWRASEVDKEAAEDARFEVPAESEQEDVTGKLTNFARPRPHAAWAREARWLTIRQARALSQARAGVLSGIGPAGYTHESRSGCALCGSPNVIGRGCTAVRHAMECQGTLIARVRRDLKMDDGYDRMALWSPSKQKTRAIAEVLASFIEQFRWATTNVIGGAAAYTPSESPARDSATPRGGAHT